MTTFTLPKSVLKYMAVLSLLTLSYTAIAQNFIEVDKLIASDREVADNFGEFAVAIDGDYALVGAKFEDEDELGNNYVESAGSVYIYERDANGQWGEIQKIVASDRVNQGQFGVSVSISGNYAVIGARGGTYNPNNDSLKDHSASAYIFERQTNGTWVEIQEIFSSDRRSYDQFGVAVSISGKNILVGALASDQFQPVRIHDAGAAYIFEQNANGLWMEKQKVVSSNRVLRAHFGAAVAISGSYAIISSTAMNGGAVPAAIIIEKNPNGTWNQVQKVFSDNVSKPDGFGCSVSLSGDIALVGESSIRYNKIGSAYIFERNPNGQWLRKQKIETSDRTIFNGFGGSVSVSGDNAIIGSRGEHFNAQGTDSLNDAGVAYVYRKTWNGQWKEEQKIVASDRAIRNYFGHTVAISNNYAICGSRNEQDLNGNNTLYRAGAAYVFETPPCINTAFSFSVVECKQYTVPSFDTTYTAVGNYMVMDAIPNDCGGDSVLTIDLTILPPKTSNVNTTICNNDSVIVNGTVYDAAHPSGTEIIPNIGPYNCDSSIVVKLNVLDLKTDSLTDILCEGDSVVVNGTTYNENHLWGTELFGNVGPYGCDSVVIIDLKLYTPVSFQPLTIEEVCVNEAVEVFADIEGGKPPYSYFWRFNETVDSFNVFRFIPNRIADDFVFFKVSDACKESDSTETAIYIKDCALVIPNVFTPNGDGVNEYFHIKGLQYYTSNNLQVYNRWGVLLFEQANYRNTWDGYQCPAGVYFYILETTKNGVSNTHKGSITLFK